MAVSKTDDVERTDDDQRDLEYYLPATASPSAEPGPVERVLSTVFRRRGGVPAFVGRRDR